MSDTSTPPPEVQLNQALLDSWVIHLRASNRSRKTIETYTEAVGQLAAFLAERGMPTAVHAIRREHGMVGVSRRAVRACNQWRACRRTWHAGTRLCSSPACSAATSLPAP
jgi:hypothetical protein